MSLETIIALVSVIMSGIVSISSIILNYQTTKFTAEANERAKRIELKTPILYESLSEITLAFSRLQRMTDQGVHDTEVLRTQSEKFSAAAYRLASLSDNSDVRAALLSLANGYIGRHGIINDSDREEFFSAITLLSEHIS